MLGQTMGGVGQAYGKANARQINTAQGHQDGICPVGIHGGLQTRACSLQLAAVEQHNALRALHNRRLRATQHGSGARACREQLQ